MYVNNFVFVRGNWEFGPSEQGVYPIPWAVNRAHRSVYLFFVSSIVYDFDLCKLSSFFHVSVDKDIGDNLRSCDNWDRIRALFQIQYKAASGLLGYVPSYNTTLDAYLARRWAKKRRNQVPNNQATEGRNAEAQATILRTDIPSSSEQLQPPSLDHRFRGVERLPLKKQSPNPFYQRHPQHGTPEL